MNRHRQNYIPTYRPRWYESRLVPVLTVIATLALVILWLTGPDDLQAERDAQADLAAAKVQAASEARRVRK